MRIEIKRLRGMLNGKADTVMSLETRRLQLETVRRFSSFWSSCFPLNDDLSGDQRTSEWDHYSSVHSSGTITWRGGQNRRSFRPITRLYRQNWEVEEEVSTALTRLPRSSQFCFSRFQIVNIAMAPPEGAKEEETSQTYYVIKVTGIQSPERLIAFVSLSLFLGSPREGRTATRRWWTWCEEPQSRTGITRLTKYSSHYR